MAEDSRSIFEKVCNSIKKHKFPPGLQTPNTHSKDIESLIDRVISQAHSEYPRVEGDRDALKEKVKQELKKENLYIRVTSTIQAYENREKVYFDEHTQLKRIENGQGLRNLKWRAATTFTIASIIFFFYWLADCLEITMPLSRVAL
ncbi:hypothetical protein [Marinobacter sp. DUT-1]|uniref:hypothetical protein n=1 Tax=Marinobacter sp. DUT-1 TaxID=3412037 RepID=UPI003D17FFEE